MTKWPDLGVVLDVIPWAVVGAVATRLYMPERATRDLDIAVVASHSEEVSQRLSAAGWTQTGDLTIGGTTWRSPHGQEVKVFEGRHDWWPVALQEAQHNRDAQGLPILPLPYLTLMKFRASRTIDIGDMTRMLGLACTSELEKTRELFRREEADGLDDLESLIELGRLELNHECIKA